MLWFKALNFTLELTTVVQHYVKSNPRCHHFSSTSAASSQVMSAMSSLPGSHHAHAGHSQQYPYGYDWATSHQAAAAAQAAHLSAQQAVAQQAAAVAANVASVSSASGTSFERSFNFPRNEVKIAEVSVICISE